MSPLFPSHSKGRLGGFFQDKEKGWADVEITMKFKEALMGQFHD